MDYKDGEIVARLYNAQVIFNGNHLETQMKSRQGKWQFVDCAVRCIHCGECLGCLRKRIVQTDEYGNVLIWDNELECNHSPNGLHEFNN